MSDKPKFYIVVDEYGVKMTNEDKSKSSWHDLHNKTALDALDRGFISKALRESLDPVQYHSSVFHLSKQVDKAVHEVVQEFNLDYDEDVDFDNIEFL